MPPPRRDPAVTLLIATRNPHKVREISALLGDGFRLLTLDDFPAAPRTTEDAGSFGGNAMKKSVELARWLAGAAPAKGQAVNFVLADDSGLEVDALHGAPGVRSARFAATERGPADAAANSPDAANNEKLLRLLAAVPLEKRRARFRCVLALTPVTRPAARNQSPVCHADESELQTELFDGACEGSIRFRAGGDGGFGYDPLFVPTGCKKSFAELGDDVKNEISHRARALEKLKARLLARAT